LIFALRNLKYIAYHAEFFESRWVAYMLASMQGSIVIIVEIINVLFLAQITCISEIVMNYVALAIISEFDDNFF